MSTDFKHSNAADSTITRDIKQIDDKTGNLYQSTAIIAKRANQIALDIKEEVISKLNEFASANDNLEEVFENREQIEVSRYYERLPKPNAIALQEFLDDDIYYREPEKVEA